MSIKKLHNFSNLKLSGDPTKDCVLLKEMLAKLEDFVASNIPAKGANGVIDTAATPEKVITVENGIITKID